MTLNTLATSENVMMKDPDSAYYTDPEEKLKYRAALTRLAGPDPDALLAAPPEAPRPSGSVFDTLQVAPTVDFKTQRLQALEKMVANPQSDYWQGTNSKELRSEYHRLLGGEEPSAEPKMQVGRVVSDTNPAPAPPAATISED